MHVVINISEDTFEKVRGFDGKHDVLIDRGEVYEAIQNSTPLPKGHGRLIDADALDLEKEVSMADDWKTAHEMANCVKYAPTIIQADKEDKVNEVL